MPQRKFSVVVFTTMLFPSLCTGLAGCQRNLATQSESIAAVNQPQATQQQLYKDADADLYRTKLEDLLKQIPLGKWTKNSDPFDVVMVMRQFKENKEFFSVKITDRNNSSWGYQFKFYLKTTNRSEPLIQAVPNDLRQKALPIYFSNPEDQSRGEAIRSAAEVLVKAAEVLSIPHFSALVHHFTQSFAQQSPKLTVEPDARSLTTEKYSGRLIGGQPNATCELVLYKNKYGDVLRFDFETLRSRESRLSAVALFAIPILWSRKDNECLDVFHRVNSYRSQGISYVRHSREIDDKSIKNVDALGDDDNDFTLKHSVYIGGVSDEHTLEYCSEIAKLRFCHRKVDYKLNQKYAGTSFGILSTFQKMSLNVQCENMEIATVTQKVL